MALYLDGIVDPVAALGGRQLNKIPWHFHLVPLNVETFNTYEVGRTWIWRNFSGRFYIGSRARVVNDRLSTDLVAAFEDSNEAVMFTFVAPTLYEDQYL